jgi:sulfoxide reductase heme-binding subunit YedZ
LSSRKLQLVVLGAALVPVGILAYRAVTGRLGANPIEEVEHATGAWSLRFLLLTLAVTPARRLFGWRRIAPLRRTLGLVAFGYVTLHALAYVGLDQFFDWQALVEDVRKRRYVTAGFAGFLCLIPLAATSTARMMKRLGRRWTTLHRLVYLAAGCGVLHFLWLAKVDRREPLVYAGALALLLGHRLWFRWASAR